MTDEKETDTIGEESASTAMLSALLSTTSDLSSYDIYDELGIDIDVMSLNEMLMATNERWVDVTIEDTQTDPIITLEKIQSLNPKGIKFVLETSTEIDIMKLYIDSNNVIISLPSSSSTTSDMDSVKFDLVTVGANYMDTISNVILYTVDDLTHSSDYVLSGTIDDDKWGIASKYNFLDNLIPLT